MICGNCFSNKYNLECNCSDLKHIRYKENGSWRITSKKFRTIECFEEWIRYIGIMKYISEYEVIECENN